MIIRYAEILLSYVEALVESGDWQNPDVLLYLNKIRNRAGMPNVNTAVYNTAEKMRELYRRERKVELAFEGTRLFDIRRWKIGEESSERARDGCYQS
ncbi:RagB/SusD family nutrient uptake outer membrane protein [Chitinophaga sp. ARDCPP14]|uniref:RagB/SusD family nutrient uptake outer membrane protein n=1 Tax=Chitinophaga sp. ARDCPP14 TaxID=3391139 RepID=UPI003F51B370